MAGRVLARFWQAALDANSAEQILTLRTEVEYIAYVKLLLETAWHLIVTSPVLLFLNLGSVSHLLVSHFFNLMPRRIVTSLIPDRYNMMLQEVAAKADGMNSITCLMDA